MAEESSTLPVQVPRASVLVNEFLSGEDLEVFGGGGTIPVNPTFEDALDQETTEGEIHEDPLHTGEGTWIVGGGWQPVEESVRNYIWWDLGQNSAVGFVEFEYMMKSGCPPIGHTNPGSPFGADYLDLHTMIMLFGEFDPQVFTAGPPVGIGTFGIEMTTGLPPNNGVFKIGNCVANDWDNCAGEQLTCVDWPYAVDAWIKVKLEWASGDTRVYFNELLVYESIGGPETLYRYFTIGGKDDTDPLDLWGTPVPPHAYQNVAAAGAEGLSQGFWGIYGRHWYVYEDPDMTISPVIRTILEDGIVVETVEYDYSAPLARQEDFKARWRKPIVLRELERHTDFGNPDDMVGKWWGEYMERVNPALYESVESGTVEPPGIVV